MTIISSIGPMKVVMLLLTSSNCILNGNAIHPGCECLIFSGTYGKDYGRFSSPDFPKPYPPGIDCLLYTFIGGSHEVIELAFTHFDIYQASPECLGGDFLKVYLHLESGGVNELTPWTGLLCGRNPPRVLYSSGPALTLLMHSQSPQANSSGFQGTFRFINKDQYKMDGTLIPGTSCDYRFVKRKGNFYSPRYPSSYTKGTRCSYVFHAKTKERIIVIFEELNLQTGDLSCLEREDVVKVHDGGSSLAPVIAILCNELSSTELISTNNRFYIEFIAGSEWPGHGFRASYHFISMSEELPILATDGPAISATTQTIATTAEILTTPTRIFVCKGTSCDVILNSDSQKEGFITSPNYPLPYPTNIDCKYQLIGSGKERIQLVFSDFNLSLSANDKITDCEESDSLSVYMQIDGVMERTSILCGNNIPPSIMSNGPRITLEFKSKLLVSTQGFCAQYIFTKSFGIMTGKQLSQYPCAFRYSSDEMQTGYFHSPNFPGNYPRDVECHYFFYGRLQERIKISFLHFDIEGIIPFKFTANSAGCLVTKPVAYQGLPAPHSVENQLVWIQFGSTVLLIKFSSTANVSALGNQPPSMCFQSMQSLRCQTTSASDYIEFSNYMSRENNNSRYCGQLDTFEVGSDSKFFRVTFKSNDRLDGRGFNASFKFYNKSQILQKMISSRSCLNKIKNILFFLVAATMFEFR